LASEIEAVLRPREDLLRELKLEVYGEGTSQQSTMESGVSELDLKTLLATVLLENRRKQEEAEDHHATKALQAIVKALGRFDGRNITKYLRSYTSEMELHRVKETAMIASFELAVVPEIKRRVKELRRRCDNDWDDFEGLLKEEFFDDDVERVTKRTFLEWIDKEPGKTMTPSEVLREFEKRYCQLTSAERLVLETKKTDLFMQAVDEATADKLWILLADKSCEDGLTTDWKKVEESVAILTKQRRGRTRGCCSGCETPSSTSTSSTSTSGLVTPQPTTKAAVPDDIMEQLVKGIKELQLDMVELKRVQATIPTANPTRPAGASRTFVERCIFCDGIDHKRKDCDVFEDYMKRGIVTFKEGRVRLAASDLILEPNWGRGGMKKFVDEQLAMAGAKSGGEAHAYTIEATRPQAGPLSSIQRETMVRGAEAIRRMTGWSDPVDAMCIKAYLEHAAMEKDAIVEDKRRRVADDEGVGTAAKKKGEKGKGVAEDPSMPSTSRAPEGVEPMDESSPPIRSEKGKEKAKGKSKSPAYKLQSDIESSTDLKGILEERILDSKIEFTLREALGIAKRDFHELIIDVIKRKRQMTAEAIMVKALDTHITQEEDEEIGQVFAQMYSTEKVILPSVDEPGKHEYHVSNCACEEDHISGKRNKEDYATPYWARATTETRVKLNDLKDHVRALVDHGSEINIMAREVYETGGWPIDLDHGWMLKSANNSKGELYGACPSVRTKVGDVEVEQNFFVQNCSSYPVILGQPYITATRMETKVLEDGSHFARIKSCDGMKSVQFLTVKANHERNRDQLRDGPMIGDDGFSGF
jgi:hypothetical protein